VEEENERMKADERKRRKKLRYEDRNGHRNEGMKDKHETQVEVTSSGPNVSEV
jgi:hypothetical protein